MSDIVMSELIEQTYEKNIGGGKFSFLNSHIMLSSKGPLEGYFPSDLKTISTLSGEDVETSQLLPT
jgi:hypothetical protein